MWPSAFHQRDSSACSQFRHRYPKPSAWLRPLALSTSQAISFSCQVPPKAWVTPLGRSWNSGSPRTQTQLPPQQSVFTALLSGTGVFGDAPGYPPRPLPWRLGSTTPRLTLLWAPGTGARGVPATTPALSQLLHWLLPRSVTSVQVPQTQRTPFLSSALGLQPAHSPRHTCL